MERLGEVLSQRQGQADAAGKSQGLAEGRPGQGVMGLRTHFHPLWLVLFYFCSMYI